MSARILFVDDNPLLLKALERAFRGRFELMTAQSGHQALDLIMDSPAFAVIVADMSMPGMDGVELLQQVKALSPDTTRIMLTGQADQLTAVEAVNSGNVFRFITKPCDEEALASIIAAGVQQHELVCASRVLLEDTLSGSIKMMVDLLSIFDPKAFGQAERIRDLALRLASRMGIPAPWDLGLAALLAPVGRMAMPLAVLSKLNWDEPLAPDEAAVLGRVPENGARIVGSIPRLQPVARIILYSAKNYNGGGWPEDDVKGEDIPLESRILFAVTGFVEGLQKRRSRSVVLETLRMARGVYDPVVLAMLGQVLEVPEDPGDDRTGRHPVPIRSLAPGMCLLEDICTPEGTLVLSAGTRLAQIHLERLRSIAAVARLAEPVMVEC